ncbi:unnamed protein product, partial [Choristocarpus tenellus]
YSCEKGTGPTLHLADKLGRLGIQLGGVIVEGSFLSLREVVASLGLPLPVFKKIDMFRNMDRMEGVDCPVLIIHGIRDEVVAVEHAKKL